MSCAWLTDRYFDLLTYNNQDTLTDYAGATIFRSFAEISAIPDSSFVFVRLFRRSEAFMGSNPFILLNDKA